MSGPLLVVVQCVCVCVPSGGGRGNASLTESLVGV